LRLNTKISFMKNTYSLILKTIQTLAVVGILVVLVLKDGREPRSNHMSDSFEAKSRNTEPIKLTEYDAVWGNNDAPNTLVAYVDYECPFCKDIYKNIKEIEDEYIKTGKVKVVFRDLPLKMHANAEKLALAAECAREQGKFWEFTHVVLMNEEKYKDGMLENWAQLLNLKLDTCMDDKQTKDIIKKDIEDARSRMLRGTPAIFINDIYYRGTMPASDIKRILDGKEPVKKKSGACN
jgi:protein-disulfide isomerase